jgi:hypothetical protein
VDPDDLLALKEQLGDVCSPQNECTADLNGDGVVSFIDLTFFLTHGCS